MPIVVFLDFDGPIFPKKVYHYAQNKGQTAKDKCCELELHKKVTYWYADPFAIAMLNELKEKYDCVLVITSTWASEELHQKKHIEALLKANGLDYTFHDDWKTKRKIEQERKEQIEEWLSRHPEVEDKYIVLDDIGSAPELFFEKSYQKGTLKQRHVYLADERDGFSYEQFIDMMFYMDILNQPKKQVKP